MKKIIILVTLFVLMIVSGCGKASESNTSPLQSMFLSTSNLITIQDYDEYLCYIEDYAMLDNFVAYENLRHFGKFASFVGRKDGRTDCVVEWYSYEFADGSGEEVYVSVNHTADRYNLESIGIISEVNEADMRFLPGDVELGTVNTYIKYGIEYHYKTGKLLSVVWRDGERTYILEGSYLYEHPLDDTVVGQLLNIEGKTEAELYSLLGGMDIAG